MHSIKKAHLLTLSLIMIPLVGLAGFSKINAQQAERINLSISPERFDIPANKGEQIPNVLRLTNGSDAPIEIETIAKNFTPVGEEGGVELTEEATPWSLADWITINPAITTIEAGDTKDFDIIIDVPSNAEPGSHFGSVVFKTIPPDSGAEGAAQVSQEIAPVILVKVAGDITEAATIESFNPTKTLWSNEDVISFETRIGNQGNVHFKPSGTVTIRNMFDNVVTTINLDEQNALPGAVRKLITEWRDPGFAIGRYTADLTLVYGSENIVLTDTASFTVFPYQTVLPIALFVGLVMFILVRFRKRVRKAMKVLLSSQ